MSTNNASQESTVDTNNNNSSSVSELLAEENQQNSSSTTTANTTATVKKKRKQVKKACLNCRKSHSACGNERPCNRCKELGITDTCQDVENKKRGRKQKSNDMVDNNNNNTQNTVKTFVFVDGMNPKSNLTTTTTTNKTTNNNNLMFINHQLPVPPQTLTTTTNNNLTTTAKKVKLNNNTQSEIVQQQQQQQGSNIQNVVPQNSSVPFQSINNNNNYGDNINNFVSTNDITNIIPKNITTPLTIANVNNNVLDLNNNIIPPPQIYNNTNLNVNFDTSNLIELLMRQNNFNQSNDVSGVGGVNGSTFTPNLGIPTDNLTSNVLNNFLNGRQQSMYNINNNHIPQPFSMPQHGFHTFNDTNGGENVNYSIPPPTIENQQNYCISNNYEDPYLTIAKLKAENEALKTKYENLYRTSEDFTKTLLGQDKGSGRGVIVSSNRGNIIMMNKVMFDTLGHSYDAIEKGIIQGWKDIIHPTCVSRVFGNLMSKVMNKVNGFCDSYLLQKRNGGIVQSTSSHFVSYDNKTNEALFSVSFLVLSEVPMISDNVGSIIIDNNGSHDKPPTLPFMQQEIPSANNINRTNTSIVDNLLMNMNATHKTNNSNAPPSSPPIEELNSEIAQRVLELLNTISNK